VRVYFTALEKIVLLGAHHDGLIIPPSAAGEGEVWLGVLLNLELRGYVRRIKGDLPMLPFCLTIMGRTLRHALETAPGGKKLRTKIHNKIVKK
jgi:hypothetical protein